MSKTVNLDRLLGWAQGNYEALIDSGKHNEQLYNVLHITRDIFCRSESVPEMEFSLNLHEMLCRRKQVVSHGWMDENDLKDILDVPPEEGQEPWDMGVEMFINPPNLFENGKVRPDVVFRKGLGNYVIFEIDSFQFHSSQQQLMKDKVRERKIQGLGHPVFRFAAKEVLEKPLEVAVEAVKILESKGFIPKKEKFYG